MRVVGVGATFDPMADAQAQFQTILAYFAAGQAATTAQYQAAQLATAALGGDLDAIQTGSLTPPATPSATVPANQPPASATPSTTKTWVSAGAAAGIATVAAVGAGTVGYLVGKGRKR